MWGELSVLEISWVLLQLFPALVQVGLCLSWLGVGMLLHPRGGQAGGELSVSSSLSHSWLGVL